MLLISRINFDWYWVEFALKISFPSAKKINPESLHADMVLAQKHRRCCSSSQPSFCSYSIKASHHTVKELEPDYGTMIGHMEKVRKTLIKPEWGNSGSSFWWGPHLGVCPWPAESNFSENSAKSFYQKYPLLASDHACYLTTLVCLQQGPCEVSLTQISLPLMFLLSNFLPLTPTLLPGYIFPLVLPVLSWAPSLSPIANPIVVVS